MSRSEPYLNIPPPPASDGPEHGNRDKGHFQTMILIIFIYSDLYKSPNSHPTSQKWSRGADSLASCWSFTLSLHSVLYLPEAILRHGGVVFLLIYIFLLIILGLPILLLEIFLGQYSTLPVGRLYRHLCPLLSGICYKD